MITVHWVEKEPNQTDWEYEFYALSTDEKPSDPKIAVNSLLCELDTGHFYYLKSKNPAVWEKVGGGSSASNLVGSAVVGTAQAG